MATTYTLVAEDNQTVQMAVVMMLIHAGCHVDCVSSGEEALEQLSKQPNYDIIFMDIGLPGIDGIVTAQRIKRLAPPLCDIPIIAVTTQNDDNVKLRCHEAGIMHCISKPLSVSTLNNLLELIEQ